MQLTGISRRTRNVVGVPEPNPQVQYAWVSRVAPNLAASPAVAAIFQSLRRRYGVVRVVHPNVSFPEGVDPDAETLCALGEADTIQHLSRIAPVSGVARVGGIAGVLSRPSRDREPCGERDAADVALGVLL